MELASQPVLAAELIPRLRGVSHAVAAFVALAAAVVVTVFASGAPMTAAAAIYGAGITILFAVSGLYHRWPSHQDRVKRALRKLDHCTIYLFIAASYTPITIGLIHGPMEWVLLGAVWAGAAAGTAFALGWIDAPPFASVATYIGLGWICLLALPQLLGALSLTPLLLLAGGGILYSVGGIFHALKRPNPWPRTFGYHEIFHALVILAAVAHYVFIFGWVLPR